LMLQPGTLSKRSSFGMLVWVLAVSHQALHWSNPGVGTGPSLGPVATAIDGFVHQGPAVAMLVLAGPIVGLWSRWTRGFAFRVLMSFVLLLLIGFSVGYLRDHHIRFLTVPALVCWGALRGRLSLVLLACLRLPPHPVFPSDLVARETTIGLAHKVVDLIEKEEPPFMVDGAWISGGPTVEPSAAILDLVLRGWGPSQINTDGDLVVIVSAEREDLPHVSQVGRLVDQGDRHRVFRSSQKEVLTWSEKLCAEGAKLGGSWDGISVISPDTDAEMIRRWWACD
jgi:hypothetical protein